MCVEVRTLGAPQREPPGQSWVLMERRQSGYFLVGRANGRPMDPHLAPSGILSPCDAIRFAIAWAEYLEASLLFVKEDGH
jgi:hypothetical protein